ncbi:phage tail protein [Bacillus sp. JJ1474]|uniref:phage tail protein n=1 Tax=Bacillus sp. JJ1474 TaxID=3122955 RepID=UPI002FFF0078
MAVKNLLIRGGADFSGIKREMEKTQKTISSFQSNISKSFTKIGGILAGAFAVKSIVDYGKEAVKTYNSVSVEVARVAQVMRNTMDATDAQIESIKRLTQAQEGIGVVAWDTQMAGAQELGTYLSNVESLKTLIPTLNDMLAQQYGVDATAEQAANIGMMIGKVMDGQLGALRRYGYSWDEAQEKVLEFGNELERANMLAEVIGQSVGGMNAELAKTPAGQLKQLEFTFAGIREQIGKGLTPVIARVLPYVQKLANWLSRVAGYFSAFMQAFFGVVAPQKQVNTSIGGAADAQEAYGDAAEGAGKKAKKAAKEAKGAIAGFDEINSLAEAASAAGDGGGVGSGGIGGDDFEIPNFDVPDIDTESIPAKIQEMADRIKAIFANIGDGAKGIGSKFKDAFSGIRPAMQPLFDAVSPIKQSLGEIGKTFIRLLDDFLKPAASYLLFDFIPSIVTGFVKDFAPVIADVAVWSMDLFSRTFKNVTDELTSLWKSTWLPSLERIKVAWIESNSSIAKSLQTLLDGTIKPLVDYLLNRFIIPISKKLNEVLVPIFTDILVTALKIFADTFKWAANLINSIYKTLIEPVFELIKKIVLDTLDIVADLWEKYGKRILDNITELFDGIRNKFQLLWDDILKPIITPFLEMLSWLWEKHLKGLVKEVGAFVLRIIDAALDILNKFILPIVNYLIKDLAPAFRTTFTFIADIVGTAVALISDIIKGLLKVLGGLIDFIVGVFTGNWMKAWEGIRDIFKGIVTMISGIFKGVLNVTIDVINAAIGLVIGSINRMIQGSIDLIRGVPGLKIDIAPIKVPRIPKLARGGIVDGATNFGNYIAGEAGAEMIVPLENTSFVNKLASALGSAVTNAMSSSQSENSINDIVIMLNEVELGRASAKGINKAQRISGKLLLNI